MNSVIFDWKIQDIERTANEAKRRFYELDSLHSDMDRMECALRESRAENDVIRAEVIKQNLTLFLINKV